MRARERAGYIIVEDSVVQDENTAIRDSICVSDLILLDASSGDPSRIWRNIVELVNNFL